MTWINGPVRLYHGTDDMGAAAIATPSPPMRHGIRIAVSAPLTDFGKGFYLTSNLHQANNWANQRYLRASRGPTPPSRAVVLQFDVDRDAAAAMETLWFVTEGQPASDYWDLIRYSRGGLAPHRPMKTDYAVVVGPVSLWPQILVIKDCDQMCFTAAGLSALPTPVVAVRGSPTIP